MIEKILETYYDQNFLKADGFDDSIIGVDISTMRLIYSVKKVLEILGKDLEFEDGYGILRL